MLDKTHENALKGPDTELMSELIIHKTPRYSTPVVMSCTPSD